MLLLVVTLKCFLSFVLHLFFKRTDTLPGFPCWIVSPGFCFSSGFSLHLLTSSLTLDLYFFMEYRHSSFYLIVSVLKTQSHFSKMTHLKPNGDQFQIKAASGVLWPTAFAMI